MQIFEQLFNGIHLHWVSIIVGLHVGLSFLTSLHVILHKENERTSLAWIGLAIFSPLVGSVFYWFFGINRIKRVAKKKHPQTLKQNLRRQDKPQKVHQIPENWQPAIVAGQKIHPLNYLGNNSVEPLINGDMAYPEMIHSIQSAKRHIVLSSYIFNYDSIGQQFVCALAEAHQRGVIVNVLFDGVGIGYGWHQTDNALKKRGVKTARFLPSFSLTCIRFINLRNHRKILCVDGEVAYLGGMNISESNEVATATNPIDDLHFKVTGPVIDQISQVFVEDWFFATGEHIQFPLYRPKIDMSEKEFGKTVLARVIQDGPDEDHNKILWTLINALSRAQTSVKIMTPYFVPDQTLMTALHAAALRGVCVEIILPKCSDVPFIDWAMQANFPRIIEHGIRLFRNNRPFDHSKVVIIDDIWSFVGSTNWDARSMEFNFEINLECFDAQLNERLKDIFAAKKQNVSRVSSKELSNLSVFKKIRNNACRLFSSYL